MSNARLRSAAQTSGHRGRGKDDASKPSDVAEALRWRRALAGSSLPTIHFRLAHFAGLN